MNRLLNSYATSVEAAVRPATVTNTKLGWPVTYVYRLEAPEVSPESDTDAAHEAKLFAINPNAPAETYTPISAVT